MTVPQDLIDRVKKVPVGAKVKFEGERQRYTVTASNERFAIMWKPFNARKTYLYTITDMKRGVRGPCNLIFGPPANVTTLAGAAVAMEMIERGEMEVSHRHCADLTPVDVATLLALQSSEQGK